MTTFIVPDANLLKTDKFFDRTLIRTILAAEESAAARLLMSEAVIDELRRQLEEELDGLANRAAKYIRKFPRSENRMGGVSHFDLNLPNKQAMLHRFERRVQQFADDQRVIPYPSTPVSELAHRSIRMERPFEQKEKGWWDTFLWLSVKEFLANNRDAEPTVILATNNNVFYGKDKESLHEDLKRELDNIGVARDAVIVERNLDDVIERFVSMRLPDADWMRDQIAGGLADGFAPDDETVLTTVNEWVIDHIDAFRAEYAAIGKAFVIKGFDLLENASLVSVTRTLNLGENLVSVGTEWKGRLTTIIDEMEEIEAFGGYPTIPAKGSMRFKLSSLVECREGKCFAQSHEVLSMDFYIDGVTAV